MTPIVKVELWRKVDNNEYYNVFYYQQSEMVVLQRVGSNWGDKIKASFLYAFFKRATKTEITLYGDYKKYGVLK